MTRSQAVNYLKRQDLHAFERDWLMGETVGVGTNPTKHENGIVGCDRMGYIVPKGDEWQVIELDNFTDDNDMLYPSLHEVCDGMVSLLNQPRCPTRESSERKKPRR